MRGRFRADRGMGGGQGVARVGEEGGSRRERRDTDRDKENGGKEDLLHGFSHMIKQARRRSKVSANICIHYECGRLW